MRKPWGRSFSHSQATTAPNSGTVAFSKEDNPVLMDSRAKAIQANGMPELSRPMKNTFFQCVASSDPRPFQSSKGNKNSEAIATRTPAAGRAPKSCAPKRMNKNDEPQIADSSRNSIAHGFAVAAAFKPYAPGPARRPCAADHRRNPSWRRSNPAPCGRAPRRSGGCEPPHPPQHARRPAGRPGH